MTDWFLTQMGSSYTENHDVRMIILFQQNAIYHANSNDSNNADCKEQCHEYFALTLFLN